jgi:heat shock protein HtpX
MINENTISFIIDTEVTSNQLENLVDYIYHQYVLPRQEDFVNVTKTIVDNKPFLAFTITEPRGEVGVEIIGDKPIQVKIASSNTVSMKFMEEVKQDLVIMVQFFEEKVRKTTLYFAWREREEFVPEKLHGKEKKTLNRLLLETQIFLFIIFIVASVFMFAIFALMDVIWLAPIVLIAFQLIITLNSAKIIARIGDWRITTDNPSIHILQYHLPTDQYDAFTKKYPKDKLLEMKKEIYENTLAVGKTIDCETAEEVFVKHGFECKSENMSTKTVNVYQLVKNTAEKFNFRIPKILVSNTMLPNAAASGPSPSRGVVLVTTGLLVQLEEDEILSVLGHEFGHLKGRDPLILFALTAAEYMFRFYVLFSFFPILFTSIFGFLYLMLVFGGIYFVAKFFEARADLVSAQVIGQPEVLAEALEKIGFRRLQSERSPSYRIQEWLSWDPHPPIYFRIGRLEKLQSPEKAKYPLLRSIKDVINGFFASL